MIYNIIQNERKCMAMSEFPISAALLDAMVLAVIEKKDSYGYQITKYIQERVSVSESTLYPVLRRLQKNGMLDVYDMPYLGRNRRYYRITDPGRKELEGYRAEWRSFSERIGHFLGERNGDAEK